MAKKLHLVHVKSNVLNRAPSASTINYGEIAVNYNADSPALYIRDNADNIVKFISEPYFLKIVGTGVTENDNETITPISEIIQQDEETVAAALNGLNDRKADSATFNTHTGTTVASRTSSQMHLPAVSASDNGKILRVANGEWALFDPATIYSGSGAPAQSLGNDGDIYLQTS